MVANPMQRKVRNSFLLGVIITLVICIVVVTAFYFLVIDKAKKEMEEEEQLRGEEKIAYVLSQEVKSGQIITPDLLKEVKIYESAMPKSYVTYDLLSTMQLQDRNGNILYLNKDGIMYMILDDYNQYEVVSNAAEDRDKVRIDVDETGYYKTKKSGEIEYIDLLDVPTVAKVDLTENTILTTNLICKKDEAVTDTLRYVEYSMLSMPTTLDYGNYIDIRLRLPNGQDLIVVSKKEIINMYGQTVGLNLTEDEILVLNSAIVESYTMMGAAELYIATYVEPGLQEAAALTYSPTIDVINLIYSDENIVTTAKNYLIEKFNNSTTRGAIDSKKAEYGEEARYNIEAGMQEQIEAARQARESYLSELQGY